jgi:hypothetical protein
MRVSILLVMVAGLVGCSGDGTGPNQHADPTRATFHFLRGNHQTAPVIGYTYHADKRKVSATITAAPGDSLFPDTLVGVYTSVVAANRARFDLIPTPVFVTWMTSDPSICTVPTAFSKNVTSNSDTLIARARRGTKAGTCKIWTEWAVGAVLVDSPDSATLTVSPGAASRNGYVWGGGGTYPTFTIPDSILHDRYGNFGIAFRVRATCSFGDACNHPSDWYASNVSVADSSIGSVGSRTVTLHTSAEGATLLIDLVDAQGTVIGVLNVHQQGNDIGLVAGGWQE